MDINAAPGTTKSAERVAARHIKPCDLSPSAGFPIALYIPLTCDNTPIVGI